ncbi:UNVERIFIED_CONTAM: DNA cytosine methyltransferase, partial [Salmonella enterica subsp. enterica serovar Rissen]
NANTWFDLVQADLEGMGYAFGLVPFAAAGIGAPHIRERAYWVAHASSKYESTAGNETGIAARLRSRSTDRLANTGGERLNRIDSLLQREESGRVTKSVFEAAGHSVTGGMGYADHSRLERHIRDDSAAGRERAVGSVTASGLHSLPLEVNGFWRDADWLLCRDGQWRPVEPGTFPLVARFAKSLGHGKSSLRAMAGRNRTGRLKGYGNAINAQAAAAFIGAYME